MDNRLLIDLRLARFKMRRQELYASVHELEQQMNDILGAQFPCPEPEVSVMPPGCLRTKTKKKAKTQSKRITVPALSEDENCWLLQYQLAGAAHERLFTDISLLRKFVNVSADSLIVQQLSCGLLDIDGRLQQTRDVL